MTKWEDWSDEDFIGYCELHCQTQRALFSGDQINRMARLARLDIHYPREQWLSMHQDMQMMCELAREYLGERS